MSETHVIKLAQPGYDVKTAGDENLIYSSLWPLLKIYKQDSYTVSDVSQTSVITDHDLNFVPFFWFFTNNSTSAYQGNVTHALERRSEFFGPGGDGIRIYGNKLTFTPSTGNLTGSLKLYYYIFGLDITKQYTAPIVKVGDVRGGSDQKHVFKLAKSGKDIRSNNLDDYVIHSRARSPLIHSVNPTGGAVTNFTVTHNLGYIPMFFPYTKNSDGSYSLTATGQGGASSFLSNENTITFQGSAAKELSIVILKDPFLIDYTVSVNI
jgi:hypothetical protein